MDSGLPVTSRTRYIRLRYDTNTEIFANDYWRVESAPGKILDADVAQQIESIKKNNEAFYHKEFSN